MEMCERSGLHNDGQETQIVCRPAAPEQFDELFQLMLKEAGDYLEQTMNLMQMTPERFRQLFETVGEVFAIYLGNRVAGFYWIEGRAGTLHLHALVVRKEFQGKGIGSKILSSLEEDYKSRMSAIELGVHHTNTSARKLYDRLGYQVVRKLPELGFEILQKSLMEKS